METPRYLFEESARSVVGPDEPYGDYTRAEMAAGHWATLAATLEKEGVEVEATEVSALQHDVEFSDRLIAQCAGMSPEWRAAQCFEAASTRESARARGCAGASFQVGGGA